MLVGMKGGRGKKATRVYLSKETRELLREICEKLGLSESETLRYCLIRFAEDVNLVKEKVHGDHL